MTAPMTFGEIVRGLERAGFPRDVAKKRAAQEIANRPDALTSSSVASAPIALPYPFSIEIPWSQLVSDNDKYAAIIRSNGSDPYPQIVLSSKYRAAKTAIRKQASELAAGREPSGEPLMLVVRVFAPDNRRGHDVANFAKLIGDALQGVVYRNDDQLHRVSFVRVGVQVDRPRAEVEVSVL